MAHPPPGQWLWMSSSGAISCGSGACVLREQGHPWSILGAPELAELGALAAARRLVVCCRCGALQYDPVSRTVLETATLREREIA